VNRRQLLKSIGIGAGALGLGRFAALTPAIGKSDLTARPNFLFILADDLGWSQIGCYGSNYYETPNVDRLASEGMRMCLTQPTCQTHYSGV